MSSVSLQELGGGGGGRGINLVNQGELALFNCPKLKFLRYVNVANEFSEVSLSGPCRVITVTTVHKETHLVFITKRLSYSYTERSGLRKGLLILLNTSENVITERNSFQEYSFINETNLLQVTLLEPLS